MKAECRIFIFQEPEAMRLDKYLASSLKDFSRAKLQAAILSGTVRVEGAVITKSSFKLSPGQEVSISLPEVVETGLQMEKIDLEVIYQDENVVAVNKPAGMIVHPGAGHTSGTLVNAALAHWPEMRTVGEPTRPGVVHRLDKDTSGVLVLARSAEAYTWLVRQFKSRKTEKIYRVLVDGQPPTPDGRVEAAIGRDPKHRQRMAVLYQGQGRKAVTEYFTRESYRDHTLLDAHPITGRTHQIRVHMAYLGCPVVGDKIYGRRKASLEIDRFFLHAGQLRVILPGERTHTEFQARLPEDLKALLDNLEKQEH